MKSYTEPELEVVHFDLNDKVMDGYGDGDTGDNPWFPGTTTAPESAIEG